MKKLFLALALTGMVSAVSASTIASLNNSAIVTVLGDNKGDDKGKKKDCCKKGEEKACCKGKATKACAKDEKSCKKGEKKACCKKDAAAATTTPETK